MRVCISASTGYVVVRYTCTLPVYVSSEVRVCVRECGTGMCCVYACVYVSRRVTHEWCLAQSWSVSSSARRARERGCWRPRQARYSAGASPSARAPSHAHSSRTPATTHRVTDRTEDTTALLRYNAVTIKI